YRADRLCRRPPGMRDRSVLRRAAALGSHQRRLARGAGECPAHPAGGRHAGAAPNTDRQKDRGRATGCPCPHLKPFPHAGGWSSRMTEDVEIKDRAAREAAANVAEYEHGWSSSIEQDFAPKGLDE